MAKKKTSRKSRGFVSAEHVEQKILFIRDQKVILDSDLAVLYGVSTKRLNEQAKRNRERFPPAFMFQLSKKEFADLKSHFATSSWGGRRTPPYAFTEHGTLMAANVLKSETAIKTSILIIETFVQLREMMSSHRDLARKLATLEKKYDHQFQVVFDAIRELMAPPPVPKKRRIGFQIPHKDDKKS